MENENLSDYSYIKSVRFNLVDNDKKLEKINQEEIEKIYSIKKSNIKDKNDKIKLEEELNQEIEHIFEVDKNNQFKIKNGEIEISKVVSIKKPWFKVYCKEDVPKNHHGENGSFYCSSCKFKTNENSKLDEFKILKSNDIVAAFNIAKRGYKYINGK